MEVGKINQNLPKKHARTSNVPANGNRVSFGADPLYFVTKKATRNGLILDQMPASIKKLINLKWVNGEAGGIIINALGTGLVAPIFIAFNPLSDKDEETKKYTALRQPVSAVLAILIQLGLTKPLEILNDYLANKGELGTHFGFNQSRLNSASYVKRNIAKNYPTDNIDEVVDNYRKKQLNSVAKELQQTGVIKNTNGTAVGNSHIVDAAKAALNDRLKDANDIIESVTDEKIEAKSKRAYLLLTKDKENGDYVLKSLCNRLQLIKTVEEAKEEIYKWKQEYAQNNPDLKEIADEFARREKVNDITERASKTLTKIDDFEKAVANAKILSENNEFLVKSLNEYRIATPERRKQLLNEFTVIAKNNGDNPKYGGLSQIVDSLRNFEDVPNERLLQKYISKYESRIGEYLGAKGNLEDIVRIYQTGYYTDEKDSATYMKKLLLELQETCKSAGDDIKAFFANINMKLKPSEIFEKEAVLKLRGKIEQRVKGYNQIASILVGLFITLPVTCSALNWVYPRFMNIFFPELANSKKSDAPEEKVKKGGHK